MKNGVKIEKGIISKIICALLIAAAGVVLYVGLQIYTSSRYQYYYNTIQVGQIADADILVNSTIDIIDEEATRLQKEENVKRVLPVFSFSFGETIDCINKFDSIRTSYAENNYPVLSTVCGPEITSLLMHENRPEILSVAYDVLNKILKSGFFDYSELAAVEENGYDTVSLINEFGGSISETKDTVTVYSAYSEYNIQSVINELVSHAGYDFLSADDYGLIKDIVLCCLKVNIRYDDLMTANRRLEAERRTQPVFISFEKGQVLIAKDRVVTDNQVYLLDLLSNSNSITFSEVIGEIIFIAIVLVLLLFLFCYFLKNDNLHLEQYLWILTISLIFTCIISFFTIQRAISFGVSFIDSFMPVCFVPILITMISGRRDIGYISSVIVGLLMSATPGSTYLTFFYCVISGSLCCLLVRFFNKRTDMFEQWISSLAVTTVLSMLFIFIGAYPNRDYVYVLLGNAVFITATHVIIAILLPLLERLLNLPTVFRLNELAYSNNPLLTKLSESAPGTYSHSKMVAELSDAASKAIGANAVLARVGGLYHDIGKTEHPEYFVENQSGVNKHEELNPSLSVSVIKSHVKVGADKAREAGLPAELIDIIANHHGNDIISYFYHEARKQADESDVISSTDFSYSDSSIPSTKECAIVMLADSVEAAARTVSGPTTGKLTKLINSIIFGKIERGQLNNCDLSMKDIDIISESFLKTLSAQYHSRIEYPDEEEGK